MWQFRAITKSRTEEQASFGKPSTQRGLIFLQVLSTCTQVKCHATATDHWLAPDKEKQRILLSILEKWVCWGRRNNLLLHKASSARALGMSPYSLELSDCREFEEGDRWSRKVSCPRFNPSAIIDKFKLSTAVMSRPDTYRSFCRSNLIRQYTSYRRHVDRYSIHRILGTESLTSMLVTMWKGGTLNECLLADLENFKKFIYPPQYGFILPLISRSSVMRFSAVLCCWGVQLSLAGFSTDRSNCIIALRESWDQIYWCWGAHSLFGANIYLYSFGLNSCGTRWDWYTFRD